MAVVVELGGQKIKVSLPEVVVEGQPFPLELAGRTLTATWMRQAALLVLRDAAGVEQNLRLRAYTASRFDGAAETQITLEAGLGAVMHYVSTTVSPDVPGQLNRSQASAASGQLVRSQITGKVLKVLVKPGDQVASGQALLIIEAMKMENRVFSQAAGTVASVAVKVGDAVQTGKELLRISS